jgi:hypothetical protein
VGTQAERFRPKEYPANSGPNRAAILLMMQSLHHSSKSSVTDRWVPSMQATEFSLKSAVRGHCSV